MSEEVMKVKLTTRSCLSSAICTDFVHGIQEIWQGWLQVCDAWAEKLCWAGLVHDGIMVSQNTVAIGAHHMMRHSTMDLTCQKCMTATLSLLCCSALSLVL